ncbi:hypothetical protein AHiyo8_10520 [Arthrobacter sp. Hiyo8]|nr:hypothetical protein AHiyo8_10520 [Arthrobacter sp. Hiyo8]
MVAFFDPRAAAIALRSSVPLTGTMPTASLPSMSTIKVLKTRSGSIPRTSAASSP